MLPYFCPCDMNYVVHFKTHKLELAKCRHCSHFTWLSSGDSSSSRSWMGFCDYRSERLSNSNLSCNHFEYKFSVQKPLNNVQQLNLFGNEKSF